MPTHALSPDEARAWTRRHLRDEFASQTPARQRDTLDRILGLLVAEYTRRRRGLQNNPSALWRLMAVWGFTEYVVRLQARSEARQ